MLKPLPTAKLTATLLTVYRQLVTTHLLIGEINKMKGYNISISVVEMSKHNTQTLCHFVSGRPFSRQQFLLTNLLMGLETKPHTPSQILTAQLGQVNGPWSVYLTKFLLIQVLKHPYECVSGAHVPLNPICFSPHSYLFLLPAYLGNRRLRSDKSVWKDMKILTAGDLKGKNG